MKKFKFTADVTHPQTKQVFKKGDVVELDSTNGQVRAWLHFGQIEEVKSKAEEKADDAESKGKGKGGEK